MQAISDKQIKQLRDTFLLFDKDGDGVLTTSEIGDILTSMGKRMDEEKINDVMKPFDADGELKKKGGGKNENSYCLPRF